MKVIMTEYLSIDLDTEKWVCRSCDTQLTSAHENYKKGLLVYDRDPREINKPVLDPERYEYTYAPDPKWVRILEYYCPHCGTMHEVEYLVPGHPPVMDMEFDIESLKKNWQGRNEVSTPPTGPDPEVRGCGHSHHN